MITARSSGRRSVAGCGVDTSARSAAKGSNPSTTPPSPDTTKRCVTSPSTGSTVVVRSTTQTTGCASGIARRKRSLGMPGGSGTTTAPAASAPRYTATDSRLFSSASTTRSPGCTPRPSNPRVTRAASSCSSPYVVCLSPSMRAIASWRPAAAPRNSSWISMASRPGGRQSLGDAIHQRAQLDGARYRPAL